MSDTAREKIAQVFQEQQAQWSSLVNQALDSSIKLVELNLHMARQSLEEGTHTAREMLHVKSPQELLTFDQSVLQDRLTQAMSYASQIGAIGSEFAAELNKTTQHQLAGTMGKISKLSAGIEAPAPVKNLFVDPAAAQQGYEQWMDAGKKFVDSFGQHFPVPRGGTTTVKPVASKAAPAAKARTKHR